MDAPFPAVPPDNRILFYRRDRSDWGFCSHFYPAPIEVDGQWWRTAEHFYQAQKSFDPEYVLAIRTAVTPGHAKRLAASPDLPRRISARSWFRKNQKKPRPDWLEVKVEIMRIADTAKFLQHPDLAARLLASGDAEIVEDSRTDAFWGTGADGARQNWAGRVLMEVRELLRERRAAATANHGLCDCPATRFEATS